MRSFVRSCGLALTFVLSASAVAAAKPAGPGPVRVTAEVTERDVAASNAKLKMAYGALIDMWTTDLEQLGTRFVAPSIVRYRGAVRTSCGIMEPHNASYCYSANTIYFDEVFVASQSKAAAQQLGTDGDMAAVGIIAHEMGHAVAMQLGQASRVPYENESAADCLAGAFALRSQKEGSLEKGDLEEAFFGLAAAGDPTPELTGVRPIDNRILRRASLMGHGTRQQRQANFNAGFESGAKACLEVFR
jgi:predicted metalloprotease